ncbi:hypothetical protein BJ138DRAFT_1148793 [Hygrophoropsis aurantiaca]|uniref:Uncharacterized protein n=1 Tax=Hygrophoropsis aurantiaca TaxID=72124 RepID=A0ACB8AG11_9AGAM|nr:hypothetical protein BJ138DRAFT_1148793 [Hygrophoropsis aurantiaca]
MKRLQFNRKSNQLAPISRLPDEILLLVMAEGVKCQTNEVSFRFERAISRVSSHWRALAISDPSLWSCVPMTPNLPSRLFDAYLQRSLNNLLCLEFRGWEPSEPPSKQRRGLLQAYLDLILSNCAFRIHSMKIFGMETELLELFVFQLRMPVLEHLSVYSTLDGRRTDLLDVGCIFDIENTVPALHSLEFEDMRLFIPTDGNNDAPAVKKLRLTTTTAYSRNADSGDLYTGHGTSIIEPSDFYNVLSTLPNLRCIILDGRVVDLASNQFPVLATFPLVETIQFYNSVAVLAEALAFINVFSGVNHLILGGSDIASFTRNLPMLAQGTWPFLKCLTIMDLEPGSLDGFPGWLNLRREAGHPKLHLEVLAPIGPADEQDTVRETLRNLVTDGLLCDSSRFNGYEML